MKKILVVDDNEYTAEALALRLNLIMKRSRILTAANGAEAVEILGREPIDLVLTDLRMPVMDGYELLAYCKDRFPRMLLSAMTAEYTPDVVKRVKGLGAAVCFEKPFDFDDVARRVRDQLRPGRGAFAELSRRLVSAFAGIGLL